MTLLLDDVIKSRPLLSCAIFFAIGVIIAYYLSILSALSLTISIILIILAVLFMMNTLIMDKRIVLIFFVILMAGFSLMNWQEIKYKSQYSLANYNGSADLDIIAVVKEDLSSLQGNKILLRPYFINQKPIKYGYIQLDKNYLPFHLNNGELIEIKLSIYQPAKEMNPGGFSNYNYLKRKGIYSQGYYEGELQYRGQINNFIIDRIITLKYHLIDLVDQTAEKPYNELLKALLLGERDGLSGEWKENFTLAGVNHLLAISGLHVGFIMAIFIFILNILNLPNILRNILLSMLIILYIILSGFRPSVFRAGLLSVFLLWARFFQRKGDTLNILGLTVLLNTLINPYQLFDIGFQLSYFILIMILFWYQIFKNKCGSVFSLSIAAFLASSPLCAYYFNSITPVSLITNIWAIPLAGLVVSIALIGLIIGLIHPVFSLLIFKLLVYPIKLLVYGINLMLIIPFGYQEVATPSFFRLLFFIFLLIVLPFLLKKRVFQVNELKRKKRLNYLVIISFIVFLIISFIPYFNRQFEVTFISVGQGDCALLRSPDDKYILVDGGGYLGLDSTQGKYTVLPYLQYKGIKELEIIFITHFDADHAMGILDILGNREVKLLVFPIDFERNEIAEMIIEKANRFNIPIILSQLGDYYRLGDLFLKVLNPDPEYRKISRNENSLVIKAEYHNFSVLLTGDLEEEGERRLLNKDILLNSTILKLGHHGSNSSSSDLFLKAVSPQNGIISVGRNNYGHPADEVIERSQKYGIGLWRTDEQGAIKVKSDGFNYTIEAYVK